MTSPERDGRAGGPAAPANPGLLHGSVGLPGVFAQAIGAVSPEISIAFAIVPVVVFAGAATPGAMLVAGIGALAVAGCMAYLSSRHSDAGGLASLVGRGLGARWGVAAGLALSMFLITAVASGVTTGTIATFLYQQYSPNSHNVLSSNWIVWAIVFSAAALVLAYLGIRPAVQVLLVLSGIGAAAIAVTIIFVLAKGGAHGIVWSALIPASHGVSFHDFILGVAVAFGPFAGMESATFLGEESVHPRRHIPIATIAVVVTSMILYVFFSLAMVSGYGASAAGTAAYEKDGFGSLLTISSRYVAPWFGKFLLFIVLIAAFTFTLSIVNEGARLFYQWGADGVLGRVFQRTSRRFRTPSVALAALAVIGALYYIAVYAWKGGSIANTVEITAFVSLVVTVTLLIAYGLVAVSGAIEGWRHRAHLAVKLVLPVISVAVVLLALYNQFIPTPPSPYQSAPYIGLGVVVVGVVVGLIRIDRRARQDAAARSGARATGLPLAALSGEEAGG
jgi:amino acid transporter